MRGLMGRTRQIQIEIKSRSEGRRGNNEAIAASEYTAMQILSLDPGAITDKNSVRGTMAHLYFRVDDAFPNDFGTLIEEIVNRTCKLTLEFDTYTGDGHAERTLRKKVDGLKERLKNMQSELDDSRSALENVDGYREAAAHWEERARTYDKRLGRLVRYANRLKAGEDKVQVQEVQEVVEDTVGDVFAHESVFEVPEGDTLEAVYESLARMLRGRGVDCSGDLGQYFGPSERTMPLKAVRRGIVLYVLGCDTVKTGDVVKRYLEVGEPLNGRFEEKVCYPEMPVYVNQLMGGLTRIGVIERPKTAYNKISDKYLLPAEVSSG